MKIKKGDKVTVITGKDKGRSGVVTRALPKLDRVIVEGINIAKKHQRGRARDQKGVMVEKPMSIHVSNVKKTS